MRLLCVSDIHGKYGRVVELLRNIEVYDVLLISGDITHLGGYEECEEVVSPFLSVGAEYRATTLAVPGNMDRPEVLDCLRNIGINLNGDGVVVGDVGFMGVGGSNKTPFSTPNELSDSEMVELLNSGYRKILEAKKKVLVSHAPPKGTKLDRSFIGFHAGSRVVRNFIEERDIDLCLCGHIHESRGEELLGKCICVNPGPLKEGYYVIIDIEEKIKVTWRKL